MTNVQCPMSNEGKNLFTSSIKYIHLSFVICSLVIFLVGCGGREESTRYYYGPSWTRGGLIIYLSGLQSVSRDIIGSQLSSTYTESARTMDTSGGSDVYLFTTTDRPPYQMSCSPARDYVGYLDGLQSGLFERVFIQNISPTSPHQGLETFELLFYPFIRSFDWSADGNKIVYCNTQEVRVRDWNDFTGTTDALVTAEAAVEAVAWQYGNRIAFYHGGILSLIYPDGSGRVNLAAAASVSQPQVSATNTNEVYGIAGGSFCKVDVSAATPATTEILANFSGSRPQLSPAVTYAVYSKSGETSGIYLLDLTAKTEAKVK